METGQFQEGIKRLMEVMDHEQEPSTRIITASYLALAYSQLGQPQNAQEWLEIGRKIDPDCKLFNRAETVLNQAVIDTP